MLVLYLILLHSIPCFIQSTKDQVAPKGLLDVTPDIFQKKIIPHLSNQDLQSLSSTSKGLKAISSDYLYRIQKMPLTTSFNLLLELLHGQDSRRLHLLLQRFQSEKQWKLMHSFFKRCELNDQINLVIQLYMLFDDSKPFKTAIESIFSNRGNYEAIIPILQKMDNDSRIRVMNSLPPRVFYFIYYVLQNDPIQQRILHRNFTIYINEHYFYVGQLKNNLPHGFGEEYELGMDGEPIISYLGAWYNGMPHGKGSKFVNGKIKYSGSFKMGHYSDYGTLFSNNKRIQQGKWKVFRDLGVPMSKLHGFGIEYEDDGKTIKKEGIWDRNQFVESRNIPKKIQRRLPFTR